MSLYEVFALRYTWVVTKGRKHKGPVDYRVFWDYFRAESVADARAQARARMKAEGITCNKIVITKRDEA